LPLAVCAKSAGCSVFAGFNMIFVMERLRHRQITRLVLTGLVAAKPVTVIFLVHVLRFIND
jgi:hypothetical protein